MALRQCRKCGKKFSRKRTKCPRCRQPLTKKGSAFTRRLAKVGIPLFFVLLLFGGSDDIEYQPVPIDSNPKKQAMRMAMINGLIHAQVFRKIDTLGGGYPVVYVGPKWDTLYPEDQGSYADLVYTYYVAENPGATMVLFSDYSTDEDLGSYSKSRGLTVTMRQLVDLGGTD